MPQKPTLAAAGLYDGPNPYSAVPDGALTTADNVVIRTPGVITPRMGFTDEANAPSSIPGAITYFGGGTVVSNGAYTLQYSSDFGATAYTSYYSSAITDYSPVDPTLARLHFVAAAKNLYLNTEYGTRVLNKLATYPVSFPGPIPLSGVPRAFDIFSATTGLAGTFLPTNSAVAYRTVFVKVDYNGNVISGAPSGRTVVVNTGAATGVRLVLRIPQEIQDYAVYSGSFDLTPSGFKYFVRIYRSLIVPSTITPDDELFQVYEALITTASTFFPATGNLDDDTPELLLGPPLYTNPKTGDGILASNFRTPIAKDIAYWQERFWSANTAQPYRSEVRLLGVGAPDGMQAGDAFAVGGRWYLAGTDFTIVTSGTGAGGPGFNVEQTARNMVQIIDSDAANDGTVVTRTRVAAFYTSADTDPPGDISFEELIYRDHFYVSTVYHHAASRPASWNPAMPTLFTVSAIAGVAGVVTVTTSVNHGFSAGDRVWIANRGAADVNYPVGIKTVTTTNGTNQFTYAEAGTGASTGSFKTYLTSFPATNDAAVSGLMYSKYSEPEAVPLLNYLSVGAKNSPIKRIFPLRDKLYVFKAEGTYIVSGDAPYFRVDLFDQTAKLFCADSVIGLNNSIFAYTTLGVASITESGVGIVSGAIENVMRLAQRYSGAETACWAASKESDQAYYLGLTTYAAGGTVSQIYVYSIRTKAWTRWVRNAPVGIWSPTNDRLVLANADTGKLATESRVTADTTGTTVSAVAIVSQTSAVAVLTLASAAGLVVGDVLATTAFTAPIGVITDIAGNNVTLTKTGSFTASPTTLQVHRGYTCAWEYSPFGPPGQSKQFKEVVWHYLPSQLRRASGTFRTNYATTATSVIVLNPNYAFSANTLDNPPVTEPWDPRMVTPLEKQRGNIQRYGMSIYEAYGQWSMDGFTPDVDPTSQRTGR